VEIAFEKGYDVVIATTPLLPETAVRQRLDWAGVPIDEFPYKLVTTLDNSYANKPSLLYYKWIAQTIGQSPSECIMVGDEDKDMVAAQIGMKTFLVQSTNTKLTTDTPEPNYRGTLADLEKLL
jgi:FMN phosphatase YigB (HAD superfamily)